MRAPSVAKQRLFTRRLYNFEEVFFRGKPTLKMATLRKLAVRVWKDEGRDIAKLPRISGGKGVRYNGRYYSYCDGEDIVLVRNERRKFVLLHELVHAMGYDYHNRPFTRKYLELLNKYDPHPSGQDLTPAAVLYGVAV